MYQQVNRISETEDPMNNKSDNLMDTLHEVESYCEMHHFVIYKGGLTAEDFPEMAWEVERDPEWAHFLEVAKKLGVRIVYARCLCFEEAHIDEALSSADVYQRQTISGFHSHVGETAAVDLAFIHEGIIHSYLKPADWYAEFCDMRQGLEANGTKG